MTKKNLGKLRNTANVWCHNVLFYEDSNPQLGIKIEMVDLDD